MAELTVAAAAKLVGKDRSTIQRYIQAGKLSASKDKSGVLVIDTAELARVFELDKSHSDKKEEREVDQSVLQATIELLKKQLDAAQARENQLLAREARLMAMLEREQETRHQLEQRLLPPGNEHGQPEIPKKGFWARIFSR